ncbi:MAG: D-alanyl-D-alanine carboxypeptidase/D-alanyl-D-alanine-endopeptidase [Actinobacteria bacterium]|nr:D-alanyl-D-alanine carboxypeptidase/D-alanyl-D-alanine-endopeptidase [Actinomycetota bacterium]
MRIKVGSLGLVGMVVCALFIGGAARAEGPTYAQLPQQAPAVLEATAVEGSTAPTPTEAGVAAAVTDIITSTRLGSATSAVVIDPTTGLTLFDYNGSTPLTPASTAKVLSAVAALQALGPQTRLATRVVTGAADGSIVLVGGGDSTLALMDRGSGDSGGADYEIIRATLTDLADATAAALAGESSIQLGYDASLFGAPYLSPDWSSADIASGAVGPVTALMVDGGRISIDIDVREDDPAAAAAQAFAGLLSERGITVTEITSAKASSGARELARVESAPIADLVTLDLTNSDNDVSEALAHLAGAKLTGVGTFASGVEATIAALTAMSISIDGVTLADGSGLSAKNAVPALALAEVMAVVARESSASRPNLWPLVPGLAIAGLTGTLNDRFAWSPEAFGIVRAKTGTLLGVSALTGTLRDVDGRVLVFAVLSNDVADIYAARPTLDAFAATLVACGCGSN